MKISIKEYLPYKELLLSKYKKVGLYKAEETAVASFLPLIALFVFLNDEYGTFQYKIDELSEFYGYTEIIKD